MASGLDEPKRCIFSDRRSERLDVRWRPLKSVPNLKHMIERYRDKAPKGRKDVKLTLLEDLPEPWSGIMQTSPDARVIHAGRFFAEERLLVEVTIAWPGKRNTDLEGRILQSIAPLDTSDGSLHWRAMGVDMTVPTDYDLVEQKSKIGKVRWIFEQEGRRGATLTLDRYALTEIWLKATVRDWLANEVTTGRIVQRSTKQINGHTAEVLLSRSWHGTLAALRGIRMLQLDVAWKCPVDTRLYHLMLRRPMRGEELELPEKMQVHCCQVITATSEADA
jgi:hypothetical protein